MNTQAIGKYENERGFCDKHGEFGHSPEYLEYLARVSKLSTFAPGGGLVFKPRCEKCAQESRAKSEEAEKRMLYTKLQSESNIPQRFGSSTFAGFNTDNQQQASVLKSIQNYAADFESVMQDGRGMIWTGKAGTGKTMLASALIDAVIRKGHSAKYTTLLDASKQIKATYGRDAEETESAVLKGFVMPDLLILDEVGIGYNSETEQLHLWEIIAGRYNQTRPTILITNLVGDEVKALIGDRIADRMRENGGRLVVFDWESYRARRTK